MIFQQFSALYFGNQASRDFQSTLNLNVGEFLKGTNTPFGQCFKCFMLTPNCLLPSTDQFELVFLIFLHTAITNLKKYNKRSFLMLTF